MTFVVAEIGVNWDGSFELAKQMIEKSKEAGCDAVKFQAFTEEMVKDHPAHARLVKSSISKTNIEKINELSKSSNIEWFCTPMYPEAVEFLEPFVNRFKIREADGRGILDGKLPKLFQRLLRTEKELIVSSQKSPRNTKFFNNSRIKWLYCVPKYPCDLADLNFADFQDFDGYSNHCSNTLAPLVASILGAKIIEVHITSDKTKNFIDNPVSFDYIELNKIVKQVRLSGKIKGLNLEKRY